MTTLLKQLWTDDAGLVISAELVMIVTLGVLAMVVGIHAVAGAVNKELNDVASAIGAFDQTYWYGGLRKSSHAWVRGAAFIDRGDFCDCTVLIETGSGGKSQSVGGGSHRVMTSPAPAPARVDPCPNGCPQAAPQPTPAPCDPCRGTTMPLLPAPDTQLPRHPPHPAPKHELPQIPPKRAL